MKLINTANNKILSHDLKIANSLVTNTLGLIKEQPGTAMLFNTRFGIHTFFMPYPIDILVLDNTLRIIQVKYHLPPNRLFFWNPIYTYVIELPSTNNKFYKIGERLKIL